MNLSKQELLAQLFILYMETAPINQEKQDKIDEIMEIVKSIAPDEIFINVFKAKLIQYHIVAQKDGFIGGFDVLKRLMK